MPAAAKTPLAVDLALVLAVDVSNSVDEAENRVQRAGYLAALRHPDFWAAIRSGVHQHAAIAYVEWAGPTECKISFVVCLGIVLAIEQSFGIARLTLDEFSIGQGWIGSVSLRN